MGLHAGGYWQTKVENPEDRLFYDLELTWRQKEN